MRALLELWAQGLGISQESSCMYNNFGNRGIWKEKNRSKYLYLIVGPAQDLQTWGELFTEHSMFFTYTTFSEVILFTFCMEEVRIKELRVYSYHLNLFWILNFSFPNFYLKSPSPTL